MYNKNMAWLTTDRQKQIDHMIEDTQLKTGLTYPEDGLIDFAKALGIEIYTVDFAQYGDNVNGVIKYDQDLQGNAKIYINASYNDERKTFTLAHELGHFLLHNDGKIKFRVDRFNYSEDSLESQQETEANYFAASILIPSEQLIRLIKVVGEDLGTIAAYFGVSKAVVKNRLKWLRQNHKTH